VASQRVVVACIAAFIFALAHLRHSARHIQVDVEVLSLETVATDSAVPWSILGEPWDPGLQMVIKATP
jgi:hypothetical protein